MAFALLEGITLVRYQAVDGSSLPDLMLAGVLLTLLVLGTAGVLGYRAMTSASRGA